MRDIDEIRTEHFERIRRLRLEDSFERDRKLPPLERELAAASADMFFANQPHDQRDDPEVAAVYGEESAELLEDDTAAVVGRVVSGEATDEEREWFMPKEDLEATLAVLAARPGAPGEIARRHFDHVVRINRVRRAALRIAEEHR